MTACCAAPGIANGPFARGEFSGAVAALHAALGDCRRENAPLITVGNDFESQTKGVPLCEQNPDISAAGFYGPAPEPHAACLDDPGDRAYII